MKLQRALKEFRVRCVSLAFYLGGYGIGGSKNRTKQTQTSLPTHRGVHTNKSFIMNLLSHPEFVGGQVDTGFIARNPELLQPVQSSNR